jgi:hypothetical protein
VSVNRERWVAERTLADLLHPQGSRPIAAIVWERSGDQLVSLARQHRVAGLLARVLDLGSTSVLDADSRSRLRQVVLQERAQVASYQPLARRACQTLERAGIAVILLKGTALGDSFYAEPELRPLTDIDLLVQPSQLDAALDALVADGFRRPPQATEHYWREAYYNLPLDHPEFEGRLLELHWSIAQSQRHAPDLIGMFARRVPAARYDFGYRLCDQDLLLHQVLHHSYHYFEPKLIWLLDIAKLLLVIDERTLFATARAWQMETVLALSLRQIEKVFPGVVSARLAEQARASWRARGLLASSASRATLELLRHSDRRLWQLIYAVWMIDRPSHALQQVRSWLSRTRRFGDRGAEHRSASKGRR